MTGDSVIGQNINKTYGGNDSDGIVNVPAKDYVNIVIETKPNQSITVSWVNKMLRELVILGTVRNVKQLSPNSIQMTIKSEFCDLVKLAIGKGAEIMKFYEVE